MRLLTVTATTLLLLHARVVSVVDASLVVRAACRLGEVQALRDSGDFLGAASLWLIAARSCATGAALGGDRIVLELVYGLVAGAHIGRDNRDRLLGLRAD